MKLSGGKAVFFYRDCMIRDLEKLPEDRKRLETARHPLEREWMQRSIADRERLLNQLDSQERAIIERIVIDGEKAASIVADTGLTVREVQIVKNGAIEKLLYCRHGAAYRP